MLQSLSRNAFRPFQVNFARCQCFKPSKRAFSQSTSRLLRSRRASQKIDAASDRATTPDLNSHRLTDSALYRLRSSRSEYEKQSREEDSSQSRHQGERQEEFNAWESAQTPYQRLDYVRDRRRRTGTVIAMGFTAINGYIWYQWSLAEPDKFESMRGGFSRATFKDRNTQALHTYLIENFTLSANNWQEHRWHTILSAGFSHQSLWHLLANTVGVMSFFPITAMGLGVPVATVSYLACIVGGSLLTLHRKGVDVIEDVKDVVTGKVEYGVSNDLAYGTSFQDELARLVGFEVPSWSIAEQKRRSNAKFQNDVPGLGASAGVCGLFTISTMMAPTAGVAVFFIPLPAWLAWSLLTGVDTLCTFDEESRQKLADKIGIMLGHEAHLGGTITGLLTAVLFFGRLFRR
ncbi:hypothetical protein BCR37DRAFT_379867 [Protomyces lactucae-debilis]|uniref:Peptidase S54 rhomboid domain-containing protein n=1 Tax=Protomyces lactucae-debilis TaxID=2754530 RepID=A0A1Y2FEB9_PROLT|nr:uncharacterized protein BCR37DRAFT_379867 [Protomyces lactucae-debilis]ORY81957.1 hypothetical protein BCR37DRAFT_379867 [Protomyces lactucae-debilis]